MRVHTTFKIRDVIVSARVYHADTGKWEELGVIARHAHTKLGRILDLLHLDFIKHLLKLASVLTQAGEEWIVDVLDAVVSNQTAFTQYGAWGTGAGTAAKADTILFTEASEARVTTTRSQSAVDKLRHLFQITCAGAGKTITNAGVLTASSAGTLIFHWDHTGQALNVGDAIEYTVDCEIT